MPEYTRASTTSSTPWLNVVHWRGNVGFVGLVATIAMPGSSPNRNVKIAAMALLFVEWPQMHSGCCGAAKSDHHAGSAALAPFPDRSPPRIAVRHRQRLSPYFASPHAIPPSHAQRYS